MALSMLPVLLCSQTITESDLLPTGFQAISHFTEIWEPSTPGAAMIWDYSELITDSVSSIWTVLPDSTPNGLEFPSSNLVEINPGFNHPGLDYFYYEVNEDGWFQPGTYIDNSLRYFQDPWQLLAFPCSYQSTWTDDVYGDNMSSGGFQIILSGSTSAIADGYGTLIMPYGSVDNVLRITDTQDYTESSPGLDAVFQNVVTMFFKPGVRYPLIVERALNVTYFGVTYPFFDFIWLEENPTGLEEQGSQDIGIDIFPNPSSGTTTVIFGAHGDMKYEVIDIKGQVALRKQLGNLSPGIHRESLNIENLPAGVYSIHISNDANEHGVKRLVIE